MKFRLQRVPRCAFVLALLITPDSPVAANVIVPLVDSLFSNPAAWKSAQLTADWKDLGTAAPGAARKELAARNYSWECRCNAALPPAAVVPCPGWMCCWWKRRRGMRPLMPPPGSRPCAKPPPRPLLVLQAKFGKPGTLVKPGVGAATGTVIQEWTTSASQVRLTLEPGNRVWVSLTPTTASAAAPSTASAAATPPPATKEDHKARVQHRDNGDVIITALPAVAEAVGVADLMLRIVQQLNSYYGWKVDCEALARSMAGFPRPRPLTR